MLVTIRVPFSAHEGSTRAQPALEIAVVSGGRISAPLEVAVGHRALADALEDKHVERAALGKLQRRAQPVRREPCAGANPQHHPP